MSLIRFAKPVCFEILFNTWSGSVALRRQAEKPTVRAVPKRAMLNSAFTMRRLWRAALWGATAAAALLFAVFSSRSEVGSQRIAAVFSPSVSPTFRSSRQFDAQVETRRLAAAVQDLAAENGQIKSQLAAIEQDMSDITGSVTRQMEAVKTAAAYDWPGGTSSTPPTAAEIASILGPEPIMSPFGAQPPSRVPASIAPPPTKSSAPELAAYGVDIGGALSLPVLRARWLGVRSAHSQLFAGLRPTVQLRQSAQSRRQELRLVVGPLPDAAAAARLCAALTPFRLSCQETHFDSQDVALE